MHQCMIPMPRLHVHELGPHMKETTVGHRRNTRNVIHGRVNDDVDVCTNDAVANRR